MQLGENQLAWLRANMPLFAYMEKTFAANRYSRKHEKIEVS